MACVFLILSLCVDLVLSTLTEDQISVFQSGGVEVTDEGKYWLFSHNAIPQHKYGPFSNENHTVTAQPNKYNITKQPKVATTPGCLPMGPIAVAINGVPMYNPYSGKGYNSVEGKNHEASDECNGHLSRYGEYHYHQIPNCLHKNSTDELLGVALDGYAIYGPLTVGDILLTSSDLDKCHGQVRNGVYEYRITSDFPYIIGCFYGETQCADMAGPGMFGCVMRKKPAIQGPEGPEGPGSLPSIDGPVGPEMPGSNEDLEGPQGPDGMPSPSGPGSPGPAAPGASVPGEIEASGPVSSPGGSLGGSPGGMPSVDEVGGMPSMDQNADDTEDMEQLHGHPIEGTWSSCYADCENPALGCNEEKHTVKPAGPTSAASRITLAFVIQGLFIVAFYML